ncbi:hypothetical protein [Streptomyces sp. bgisy100]|uniref:hypothetical protein n=1 Tax=Streptomyces sp. bgisy100 TaxID=3413783 RepID=UPI003D7046DB
MAATQDKPPTVLSHGELPYPRGTLVGNVETGRTGELQGVVEERTKEGNRLVSRTAYMRPRGGGREWEAPLTHIRPVDENE